MAMAAKVTEAMILAAGEGTRLRPLTLETPKALLPVGGVPLIEYQISWLKTHGISQVAVNLHHLGDEIKDFLGDGSRFGIKIFYSAEEDLLGTAGGVKRLQAFFASTFVVVYGDVLTDFDLGAMVSFHRTKDSLATLAILKVVNPWEVGVLEVNEAGRVLSFAEKPPLGSEKSSLGNGGVFVLEPGIFNHMPAKGYADFAYDIFPKLVELELPVYGYILEPESYLIDIGTIEKYQQANRDVKAGRVEIGRGQG